MDLLKCFELCQALWQEPVQDQEEAQQVTQQIDINKAWDELNVFIQNKQS